MPLQNMQDIGTVSLYLHNLCILKSGEFDMDSAKNIEEELKREVHMALDRLHEKDKFM